MFGILRLDCEGGKQGNYSFFGFPLDESSEMGGEAGLSFAEAQKNCKAQNWILPTVFGLARIVMMLYHKYIFDHSLKQVENKKTEQNTIGPWIWTPMRSCVLKYCLSPKKSEWINNKILLGSFMTPIMFALILQMIYNFVYY